MGAVLLRPAFIRGRFAASCLNLGAVSVYFGFFRFIQVYSDFFGFFRFIQIYSNCFSVSFGFFKKPGGNFRFLNVFQDTGRKPRGRKPPGLLKKPKETEKISINLNKPKETEKI